MVTIFVRWDFVGFHHWPNASESRAYLASRHRHKFFCEAEITVFHNDREVEFHDLLQYCVNFTKQYEQAGARSCETMAREIAMALRQLYPDREYSVTVTEDNECGAKFRFDR